MNITEMITKLEAIKNEYGDLSIKLADKYRHYQIKWVDCSEGTNEKHFCIRINDAYIGND